MSTGINLTRPLTALFDPMPEFVTLAQLESALGVVKTSRMVQLRIHKWMVKQGWRGSARRIDGLRMRVYMPSPFCAHPEREGLAGSPEPATKGAPEVSNLVPGQMHCARCKFQLTRTTLYMSNGTVGAGDSKTEPCPNGCGPLWPVTWEQAARDAWATCETLFERAKAAKDALTAINPPHLVASRAAPSAGQIITLCGSARFERLFKAWNESLTMAGHTVFSLTAYPSDKAGVKQWYTEEQKAALDAAHLRKIEASDAVFVLNRHAYIGESTLREVEYARQLGKTVYFLESWGKGYGIGGSHTDAAQRTAEADGLTIPTASPIDTTTRSGSRDPWASHLLGAAGALRSAIVDLTKDAGLAQPAPCGYLCRQDERLGFIPETGCPVHDEPAVQPTDPAASVSKGGAA